MIKVRLTIRGEPASKANSRQNVTGISKKGKRYIKSIKSDKALKYATDVARQVPLTVPLMTGELLVVLDIYYASERPDMDESIILDALQGRVYENDRQVRARIVNHFIDRKNPRAEILIMTRPSSSPMVESMFRDG